MIGRGERLDWFASGEVIIEFALVTTGLYVFVVQGLTAKYPMVNLRLFSDRNYLLGVVFVFLYGLLSLAPLVMLPPFLQSLQGYVRDVADDYDGSGNSTKSIVSPRLHGPAAR